MTGERRASAKVHRHSSSPVRRHRERGVVYLLVLSTTIVVLAIMLGSIAVVRAQRAEAFDTFATTRAATLARSGLELAMSRIEASGSNWRDDYVAGESSGVNVAMVDRGIIIYRVSDPDDGDLRDDPWDEVEITGYGIWNEAQRMMSLRATPTGTPLELLSSSIHAGGDITFDGSVFVGDRPATSNGDVVGQGVAGVIAPVEAAGSVSGGEFVSGTRTGRPPLSMPDPGEVVRFYADRGQTVSIDSVAPSGMLRNAEIARGITLNGLIIESDVLVIQCAGRDIEISDCRIGMTIVLLNAGSGSRLSGAVSWKPAREGLPALIVEGDLQIMLDAGDLEEVSAGVSLNTMLAASDGSTDGDTSDAYPSLLQGLFYVTRELTVGGQTNIAGCVVAHESMEIRGTVLVQPDAALDRRAPRAFASPDRLVLQRGTLRRVVP